MTDTQLELFNETNYRVLTTDSVFRILNTNIFYYGTLIKHRLTFGLLIGRPVILDISNSVNRARKLLTMRRDRNNELFIEVEDMHTGEIRYFNEKDEINVTKTA